MAYDMIRWEEKAIVDAARKKGVELNPVDCRDLCFDLQKECYEDFGDIILQRCVSYYRNLHLTALFETKGIPVVNGFKEAIIAGNKLFSTLALVKAKVPTPKTFLSFTPKGSFAALEKLGYPAVLKPAIGSWGRLVALLKDRDSAEAVLEDREYMFPLYQVYYLQENVKRPPRDIRSFVLGDRVVAAIYRVAAEGQFRTNTARGGRAVNCPVTPELEELSLKAAKAIGEGFFGVDCMETPEELVVHEVNNTTEFKNSVPATKVDIPGMIVDYVIRRAKC